ncbi:malate dehydrogenase [Coxiella endosymbiont of Amblyomma americanum]|uniref:malate dehydrogenase n=1 Tax=Coxiella endosymbiont of Amblyomma americanum TaxID=325775 RepID=UPI00057D43FC|nr:malate dehydrogenase [Coxiella endosymbiont of Amblyomma americanum]AJC50627.1 malate dehydrogenase [Coxiella endosymbiont of Amblyomma americanum]
MKQHIRVAITGAAGQISYALLFRLASGQVFGLDTTLDLRLLEIAPAFFVLKGIVMELEDCAFPLLRNIVITLDPKIAFNNVNWAFLIGSSPRRKNMERKDLLEKNGEIFAIHGKALNENAANDIRTLVVGNPCNTNCLVAMHHAPDVPNDRFYAMTRLDQNRAVYQLALKAQTEITAIKNMIIWGNHSSTQFPDFYHSLINDKCAMDVINDEKWFIEEFIPIVQKRGFAVIETRGSSSSASAANAIIDSVWNLTHPTSINDSNYSIALCSKGEYAVDAGLIFSFPCYTENSRVIKIVKDIKHNAFGQKKLKETVNELRRERDAVKALKLI